MSLQGQDQSYSSTAMALPQMDVAEFEEILEDRRKYGVLNWVTQDWDCPRYQHCIYRKPEDFKTEVLKSPRVQNAICEVSLATGKSQKELYQECKTTLEEMAHKFDMFYVRSFGIFLANVWKRIYSGIYVSRKGIEMTREVCTKYPMVYMPTHRSYCDFLLISYICFHFKLPIPVIASGLDFLGMNVISKLMRGSGAFFIRRSFGDDQLYWAIFEEYVQLNVRYGYTPLEFFVEGTRSRTAKSLAPKVGLLQVILDLYFTSQVPDITIVPVGITYDRTLEETLYSYELLGVPKPKESTSGLVKARSILKDNYGNVFVQMGKPISVRELCDSLVDRSLHLLRPRFLFHSTSQEQRAVLRIAKHVIRTSERLLVLSPFPLVSLVLAYYTNGHIGAVHLDVLMEELEWLRRLVELTGATALWNDCSGSCDYLLSHLSIHSNIVRVTPHKMVEVIEFPVMDSNVPQELKTLSPQIIASALPHMYLYHYGNQCLQLIAHHALISLIVFVSSGNSIQEEEIFYKFCILQEILQKDFVYDPENSKLEFTTALANLQHEGILQVDSSSVRPVDGSQGRLAFLASLLSPFVDGYMVSCQTLLDLTNEGMKPKALVQICQQAVEQSLIEGRIGNPKSLSMDILNNCINSLISIGAIRKDKRENQVFLFPRRSEIEKVARNLEMVLPLGQFELSESSRLEAMTYSKL